ncbi:vomeronasal secretory protein 2-like [Peromyscus maniculatus bairdii]|uniref:vomeronasal secretory protein 2-like n=1 Tax=Peromyscus maniculatus bairdii TaxID=230844 RepID=UPI001C2EBAE4|nr:vomeronasal secretory protein 2-like isoform X1 [Peromyscus maniculatus bairdii]
MQSLLLTVTLFVLVAVLQAQDDLPFLSEDKNFSGTWYLKATVKDLNSTEWKNPKEEFPFVVRALENGNMEVMAVSMYNGECLQIDILLEKTEKPGQYSAFWDTNLMYIYELPVMDHYIFYSECQIFEQKVYAGELIGKDPTENHEALEEFKKFVQQKGFPPENIIVPEQRDTCFPKDHFAALQKCKP